MMTRLTLVITLLLGYGFTHSQNTLKFLVKDADSSVPLIGVNVFVEGTEIGASTNESGLATLNNIPDGTLSIVVSYIGYETVEQIYDFPSSSGQTITIRLEEGEEMETVTVNATRSTRTIEEIPTRIEFLGAEELVEKAVMNSTNIAMLLRESTGIQMQITSPNSANQSIRIQGLVGRYTQLLKDGFPLFGGFAGGLSIMQIPPLDLKQVEVIKGSASTLYGGGAIAGLVNLVTKQPEESPEFSLMFNQTSASGTTLNGFYAQKYGKTGVSLFASANRQEPFDPNNDDFSDIPQVRGLTINPRFYWYPDESSTLWVGVNTTFEERIGGDIQVIEGNGNEDRVYSEEHISDRISTQLAFDKSFSNGGKLSVRNSFNFFDRTIDIPTFKFDGQQVASFSEVNYTFGVPRSQWVIGGNLRIDQFQEEVFADVDLRNYNTTTWGGFLQNVLDLNDAFVLESGLRTDYNSDFGSFVLPKISLLFKISPKLSGRLGGGLGYQLPTIFTEEAESRIFQHILPINQQMTEAEQSIGGNFDLNYKTIIGDKLTFSINQFFFYTQLENAIVLQPEGNTGDFSFVNANGNIDSRGFETNIKFTYGDFKLFLQYAFIDAQLKFDNINNQKPLTPKHNAGAILVFEQHGKWRIGLESYYTGRQFRSDLSQTRDYWIVGLMGLRQFEKFGVFLNLENFTDTRQSRYQDIVTPPINNPTFAEIWAPTDGFVINGGFIWNLFKKEEEHHHH